MRRARRNLNCPIEPLACENAVRPSAARSDDEGDASEHRPRREAPCDEAERRPTRARSDPRPARVCDRAPAPPAPAGLAGLCVTSYASARVWPASRRSRIYGHEYLGHCLSSTIEPSTMTLG